MAPTLNNPTKKQFGHSLRADFLIAEDYTLMNHGSYGTYPAVVRTALRHYQDRAENCIDTWFRRDMYTEVQKAKEKLASLVHCDADDLAFVANASTGVNSVARSLPFQPGDKILQVQCRS
jgi:hercynylcysteine S-oxide lyase